MYNPRQYRNNAAFAGFNHGRVFRAQTSAISAGNPFLGRYQSGRDDGSHYGDKEKYEQSKWHVHR